MFRLAEDLLRHLTSEQRAEGDTSTTQADRSEHTVIEPMHVRVLIDCHADPAGDLFLPFELSDVGEHVPHTLSGLDDRRVTIDAEGGPIDAHMQAAIHSLADAGEEPPRVGERVAARQDCPGQVVGRGSLTIW